MPKSVQKGSQKMVQRAAKEPLLRSLWPLVATGCQNGAKGLIMVHFPPFWVPFYTKMIKNDDLLWETKLNVNKKTLERFLKLASAPPFFLFYFVLVFFAEYGPLGNGSSWGIRRPLSVFGNWRALRHIFHYILWLILFAAFP